MSAQYRTEARQYVIWNRSLGRVVQVTIGQVADGKEGRECFLEPPFDFVGPLRLDELETRGELAFAACLILSRQRWREVQADLRRDAHAQRRARAGRRPFQHDAAHQARHREVLNLPLEGALRAAEIKAAFRRLAKTAHPDVGGSSEQFHRITVARDALLERAPEATL